MKRVAVVNDDRQFIDLVRELLREKNWETVALTEGDSAFDTIKREQPDLVILDIRMEQPDTGWRVLNLLMLDPSTRGIAVIMCSADWRELDEKEPWLNQRHVGILRRPFDLDDLYLAVEQTLARDMPEQNEMRGGC